MHKQLIICNATRKLENKYYNLKLTKGKIIIDVLKKQLNDKTNEIINLNEQIKQFAYNKNDQIVDDLKKENNILHKENEKIKKEIDKIKTENCKLVNDNKLLKDSNDIQVQELNKGNKKQKINNKDNKEISKLKEENTKIQNSKRETEMINKDLAEENNKLRDEILKLKNDLKTENLKYKASTKEVDDAEDETIKKDSKTVKDLKKQNKKLEKLKINYEKINKDLKKEIEELKSNKQNENRQHDLTDYKLENANLIKELSKYKKLELEAVEIKTKLESLNEENLYLKKIIDNLENTNLKYQKDLNESSNIMNVFERLSGKLEDIKKELVNKNLEINEEIKQFKSLVKSSHLPVDITKDETLKDNTIKILKESLKLKDKLLSQNITNSNINFTEDKDVLENEIIYQEEPKKIKTQVKKSRDQPKQKKKQKMNIEKNTIDEDIKESNDFNDIVKTKAKLASQKINAKPFTNKNNTSFFANLSFADSSPVHRRYDKK